MYLQSSDNVIIVLSVITFIRIKDISTEAVSQSCSVKKVFLKNLQNSPEKTFFTEPL